MIAHLYINGGDQTIVDWKFWSLDLVIEFFWLPNLMIQNLDTQKILIVELV
jgi:hypothetical protein